MHMQQLFVQNPKEKSPTPYTLNNLHIVPLLKAGTIRQGLYIESWRLH